MVHISQRSSASASERHTGHAFWAPALFNADRTGFQDDRGIPEIEEYGTVPYGYEGLRNQVFQEWKKPRTLEDLTNQIDAGTDAVKDCTEDNENDNTAAAEYDLAEQVHEAVVPMETLGLSSSEVLTNLLVAKSQQHQQVAVTAQNTDGTNWDIEEQRQALASERRAKAVPDEAITARMHAER